MKLVAKGSQIDISIYPIKEEYMNDILKEMRNRFNQEENDPIIGYIKNDMFYSLSLEENPIGTKDHYSLNFVKKYDDTCWIVLNKHPSQLYNPMSYLTLCNTFNVGG